MKTFGKADVRDVVKQRVQSLSPDSERRWGRMTVMQMLHHLDGAQRIILEDQAFPEMKPMSGIVRIIALRTPLPWPKGVPTGRDPLAVDIPRGEFDAVRARVLEGIEGFAAWSKTGATPVHPVFGDLSAWEWLRWAYRHADHHLRQFSA